MRSPRWISDRQRLPAMHAGLVAMRADPSGIALLGMSTRWTLLLLRCISPKLVLLIHQQT